MADIPEERKRQIRAEEEARAEQRAEEKYRAEVRRELEGAPPTTVRGHAPAPARPAPTAKPTEPARPASRERRGGILVVLGALVILGGIASLVIGATREGPRDQNQEIVADGSGVLTPTARPWKPAELAYPKLAYKDGVATEVPDPGMTTLGAVAKQAADVPQIGGPPVTPPPATSGRLDPLLGHVPTDAFALLAIDLTRARSSRSVMEGLDAMLKQSGLGSKIDAIGVMPRANAIVIAGVPAGPRQDPWPVVVIRGAFDATQFPTGNGVGVDGDLVVIAAPEVFDRAMNGSSVLSAGELADALDGVRGGPTGFGAIRMMDEMKSELAQLIPDLEKVRWLAGTVDTTSGIALTGNAMFPDDMTAAKIAIAINLGRKLAASQMPSAAFGAAVDKLALTAMGNAIRISATWTEADAQALLSVVR